MDDCDLLFVYGTLRGNSDHPMARRLKAEAIHLGPARWRGRLYDLGPYPAAVRDAGHLRVQGDLYRFDPAGPLLAALDAYEGYDPRDPRPDWYVREVDQVEHEQVTRPAWVYRFTGPVPRRAWIPQGDWSLRAIGTPVPPG